ncbi:MAG: DUF4372 domain-containing protein [Candidatus Cryptobacteroides sp.]|nr:DUF4372 domain-containing protein [Bacteroidales bacterium]MDY5743961.1 DUF4372 domain-containing protein [Candidatus Cryptobacteroides sp.]
MRSADTKITTSNRYSHCLHLMFGQLAGCKSLKDITLVLRPVNKAAYHLGIPCYWHG